MGMSSAAQAAAAAAGRSGSTVTRAAVSTAHEFQRPAMQSGMTTARQAVVGGQNVLGRGRSSTRTGAGEQAHITAVGPRSTLSPAGYNMAFPTAPLSGAAY